MTFRSQFEHRDELLRAAIDEFSEHGYDAASINRILARSRVSKGQFYHHFTGKEGLFLALVEWMIDAKTAWLAAHPPQPPGDDFFASLAAQINAALGFAAAHADADRLTRALLAERGRSIFETVTQRFGFSPTGALGALVAHHHARGAFRSDLPLDLVQRVVSLVVNRAPELLALDQPSDLTRQVDDLLSLLRDGLAHRP